MFVVYLSQTQTDRNKKTFSANRTEHMKKNSWQRRKNQILNFRSKMWRFVAFLLIYIKIWTNKRSADESRVKIIFSCSEILFLHERLSQSDAKMMECNWVQLLKYWTEAQFLKYWCFNLYFLWLRGKNCSRIPSLKSEFWENKSGYQVYIQISELKVAMPRKNSNFIVWILCLLTVNNEQTNKHQILCLSILRQNKCKIGTNIVYQSQNALNQKDESSNGSRNF